MIHRLRPVGVALEAHERALAPMPRAELQSVRVARAGGDLRADTEVASVVVLRKLAGHLVS